MSNETAEAPILLDIVEDHIAMIRLNRPQARNAIDGPSALAIAAAVERVESDPAIRVAILTSSTPGMFCAGADLKVVAAGRVAELRPGDGGFAGFVDAIRNKPWIAAVDGPALGGGTELCLACDIIVATPDSKFGLPEVKRGILANGGGISRLGRALPRNIALELIATGDPFTAQFAADHGMVNRLSSPEKLIETAMELARAISGNAPGSVRESLYVARKVGDICDAELRRISKDRAKVVFATEDAQEGPRAFAEKRAPVWQGR